MFKRFKYSLSGAQRLEAYTLDELALELNTLKEELSAQLTRHAELSAAIGEGERQRTSLFERHPLIWMETREATEAHLQEQRAELHRVQEEMEVLRQRMTAAIENIVDARKRQRVLERHSEACKERFEADQDKRWENWLDDMWLAARRAQDRSGR